jgi:hypothetical protein
MVPKKINLPLTHMVLTNQSKSINNEWSPQTFSPSNG